MNENLNLVEILKDCPKGTKLYSALHGEVEFLQIEKDDKYSIICCQNGYFKRFNAQGLNYYSTDDGECILFPSKEQRDWSKFNIEPKFDISTLKPFDKVLVRNGILEKWECTFFSHIHINDYNDKVFVCNCFYKAECVPYNEETKHLVGTTEMPPKKYINWEE